MYATSSGESRKLIGTSTRPKPQTPKYDVKSRALLWETNATRSPTSRPSCVESGGLAPARAHRPCV